MVITLIVGVLNAASIFGLITILLGFGSTHIPLNHSVIGMVRSSDPDLFMKLEELIG